MTQETRIKLALDKRDEEVKNLDEEYRYRFDMAKTVTGEDECCKALVEVNMWHVQELNRIDNEFIKAIKGE